MLSVQSLRQKFRERPFQIIDDKLMLCTLVRSGTPETPAGEDRHRYAWAQPKQLGEDV
jgi:hypothetical protein